MTAIDRCRTAVWARFIQFRLDENFSAIERLLIPTCFQEREDGGGYSQPQLFRKYAKGLVCPSAKTKGDKESIIAIAERLVPGSAAVYDSILWQVLAAPAIDGDFAKRQIDRLSIPIRQRLMKNQPDHSDPWDRFQAMRGDEFAEFIRACNLDVLAAMIIRCRLNEARGISKYAGAGYIRYWLAQVFEQDDFYRSVQPFLVYVLELHVPWLGSLSEDGDLVTHACIEDHVHTALFSELMGSIFKRSPIQPWGKI